MSAPLRLVIGLWATRRARVVGAVAALAVAAVVVAFLASPTHSRHVAVPPTPPGPTTAASPGRSTSTPPTNAATREPIRCPPARRSASGGASPGSICIPAIRVDASVMSLGLNADRTVQVPPLSEVGDAGWYRYSAAPGAVGPTVILGHVDSAQFGEGVFFRLGELRAGDRVVIARHDGQTATFAIDHVVEVSKRAFPTQDVYGPTAGPALRLVTCGGPFDRATGNYLDNIIVYATMVSLTRA